MAKMSYCGGKLVSVKGFHARWESGGGGAYRVCEEANTGDHNGTNVVPAERGLVNLSESQPTALIKV
jgi:hypothetical protein